MAFSNPSQQYGYQAFPKLDSQIIDANGRLTEPWYRLLISLWQKQGGSKTQQALAQVLQAGTGAGNIPNGSVMAYEANSGDLIGQVVINGSPSINTLISLLLEILTPPDQPRQQFVPPVPVDQARQQFHASLMMDSFGNANIVNTALMLGA